MPGPQLPGAGVLLKTPLTGPYPEDLSDPMRLK